MTQPSPPHSLPPPTPIRRALWAIKKFFYSVCRYLKVSPPAQIIDFQTQAPVQTDDEFMDAMLAKVSLRGEDSLSSQEKRRMIAISKRKK